MRTRHVGLFSGGKLQQLQTSMATAKEGSYDEVVALCESTAT